MAASFFWVWPSMTASTSSSFMMRNSSPSSLISWHGILAEENPVARFDVERDPLAIVFHLPVAGGDDRALLRLLFGGVRDDPADVLCALVDALNNEAVV